MSYPINYPTPQGANIQIFNATGGTASSPKTISTWVKPQGASFVWFTLIGAGGGGDNSSAGGGSGAVTNCMVPAFLIPDSLQVYVGKGGDGVAGIAGEDTAIVYQQKDTSGYTLLTALHGDNAANGGSASTSNYFSCMGFFQSVAGQSGIVGGQTASTTTFLSGGGASGATVGNYGYSAPCGYFQMQPIIVGVGGGGSGALIGQGGIGCGGGYQGNGGNGLVVIITW